jgi:predicted AAA+ superfamily ATPase
VFGVAASAPSQIMSLQKIQGQLQDPSALETIAHYLALLEEAFLIAPLPKYSTRAARQRAAPPKLVPLNNAIVAVMDPRGIPDRATDPERWGTWVENACLAYAWSAGQRVRYWREEPLEVDGVLDGSWGAWAIEVKTGRASARDLKGLGEFARRHAEFRPLVICDDEARVVAERAGFDATHWTDFLLHGPPRSAKKGG